VERKSGRHRGEAAWFIGRVEWVGLVAGSETHKRSATHETNKIDVHFRLRVPLSPNPTYLTPNGQKSLGRLSHAGGVCVTNTTRTVPSPTRTQIRWLPVRQRWSGVARRGRSCPCSLPFPWPREHRCRAAGYQPLPDAVGPTGAFSAPQRTSKDCAPSNDSTVVLSGQCEIDVNAIGQVGPIRAYF
jgi:hypothetical protein